MGYNLIDIEKYLLCFFSKYPFEYLEERIEEILLQIPDKGFGGVEVGGSGSTDIIRLILSFYNYDWYDFDIISLGNLSGSYYDYVILIYKEVAGIDIEKVKEKRKKFTETDYSNVKTSYNLNYDEVFEKNKQDKLNDIAEEFICSSDFEFFYEMHDYSAECVICLEKSDYCHHDTENYEIICDNCYSLIENIISKRENIEN